MTNRFLMWGWFDGSTFTLVFTLRTHVCDQGVSVSCEIDSQKSVHDSIRGTEII